ncbi:MAG: 50S ribosomal protein L6 [bacterium]|nr:50S ribosomal protein L6 [bacterium]MDZ4231807.1 50S ribosomal protein L6 [Candidatus Pacearchaeota archaeon]
MSRVGSKPIEIPAGVEVQIKENGVAVKGPKGELERKLHDEVRVRQEDGKLIFEVSENPTKTERSLWGLERSLVANLLEGVTNGFERRLQIEGVGYRAVVEDGGDLVMQLGFSHPVKLTPPDGVQVAVEKSTVVVSGIDKQKVTGFAAEIRRVKPPEPYKGKGIRYEGEIVRRKLGKRAAGAA